MILVCREVIVKSSVLFLLNIGAEIDKTVCETIYTTTFSKFAHSAQNVQKIQTKTKKVKPK